MGTLFRVTKDMEMSEKTRLEYLKVCVVGWSET